MTELKTYSLKEVQNHSDNTSAWFIIDNYVYDVTEFLNEHPGGEEVLLEQAGADATESFEDVGHSNDARDLMKKYRIGQLIESDKIIVENSSSKDTVRPESNNDINSEEASSNNNRVPNNFSWLEWSLPLIGAAILGTVTRYFLEKHYGKANQ